MYRREIKFRSLFEDVMSVPQVGQGILNTIAICEAGAEPSKHTAPNLCARVWCSRVLGPLKEPRKKLAPRYSVESNEGAGDWRKNIILNYTTETGSKIVWS